MSLSGVKKILKLDAKGLAWQYAGIRMEEFYKAQAKAKKLSTEKFDALSPSMKNHVYEFAWFYVINEKRYERSEDDTR